MKFIKMIFILLFVFILNSKPLFAHGDLGNGHMMDDTCHSFGSGWILMVLFWLLVILAFVWLIKILANKNISSRADTPRALEILKERYAKGEINEKEFEEKKKKLV